MRLYYGGQVVHQSQSDEGVVEVVDLGETRSLHFGSYPRQSAMSLTTPHTLELTYTQSMMASLLLQPNPKSALVIGLGGGSLVKFLLHHYPECSVDAVEYREDVVKVAHGYFQVPEEDTRLNIHRGDAYMHVQTLFDQGEAEYDLILVDAYNHEGMAVSVGAQAFFDVCAGILSDDGVLSVNLWGSNRPLFNQSIARINRSFDNKTMILPVEKKGNVIGLASNKMFSTTELKQLKKTVESQEHKLAINLPKSLQDLIRQNRTFISRLFV